MSVIEEIAAERERQKVVEGWSPEHDDLYVDGEMAAAAACYVIHGSGWERKILTPLTMLWPWSLKWWKPKSPRRDLIRAGALIVAEIERLDRRSPNPCDCERGHNGIGMAGRECDCPSPRSPKGDEDG